MTNLLSGTVMPALKDGLYSVKLAGFREVANAQGGYVELNIQLPDRVMTWAVFPGQLNYVFSGLQRAFGLEEEEVSKMDLLERAKVEEFEIYTYVDSYSRRDGREATGRSWSFTAPAVPENPADIEI